MGSFENVALYAMAFALITTFQRAEASMENIVQSIEILAPRSPGDPLR